MYGAVNTSSYIATSSNGGSTDRDISCCIPVRKGGNTSFYISLPSTLDSDEIRILRFMYDVGTPSIIKY